MKSKDVYFFPILNIVSLILESRNFYQQKSHPQSFIVQVSLTIFDLWHPAEYREPHQTLWPRVCHHHIQKVVHIDRSILSETKRTV